MVLLIDELAHRRNRDRVASDFASHSFLKEAVVERVIDRLDIVKRDFDLVADLGCHTGQLTERLAAHPKIGKVVAVDPSPVMAAAASAKNHHAVASSYGELPFAEASFDAVFSSLALHWANGLPEVLKGLKRILKPDGLLIVALLGGKTLSDLRATLAEAENQVSGGVSPRVMPMGDIRDLGGLLGQAGFALPVADSDVLTVTWSDIFAMMKELRHMGEGNALVGKLPHFTPKSVFDKASQIYKERFATKDGQIKADFEIITLTAWTPHESQPQALRPGSGKVNLADALKSE